VSFSPVLPDVDAIAAHIADGCRLGLPVDYAGVSMASVPAILRRAPRDLAVVSVPTGGLAADVLIGAGLVASLETSAMSLGEAGGAPCFARAMAKGGITMRDATCPALLAALMAAQKGSPFTTLRGLIGSDVLRYRPDWRVIQNPFSDTPDPVVALPALHLDVSIFHAPMADSEGNVWIGRRRELAALAYASRQTFVTVERIVDGSLLADEITAAGVLPALYVTGVVHAPNGAKPYGLWGEYPADTARLQHYAKVAKSEEGFKQWLAEEYAR